MLRRKEAGELPKQNAPRRAAVRRKEAPVKKEKKDKKDKKTAKAPKTPKTGKKSEGKGVILGLVALLALAALYAALCVSVNPEQVLPRTRVVYQSPSASTDASVPEEQILVLSGLNQEGVERTLEQDFHSRYDSRSFTVRACGSDYIVPVGNALAVDVESVTDKALAPSQAPFLWRGLSRIRSLITWRDLKVQPRVDNEKRLRASIRISGLLDVNTTVQTTYEIKDKQLLVHKGKSGQSVDVDGLVQQLSDAAMAGDFETPVESAMVDGQVNEMDWAAVEQKLCQKARSAELKLSKNRRKYEIVESVTGVSFDRAQAQQALEAAGEGSDAVVELVYQEPEITTKQLKKRLFKDKLGTYTTSVSGTWNRISNVRLAAEKCDGIILLKGDKFSYNDTLGERTEANGFKTAGAYLNGATVQELGGGICQISSTMYAAVLNANMKIVERHNHTFASSYIGLGMDATVSWGGPDFRWQNDKDYPVKIEASYWDGYATVTIWGTRTDKLTVEMVSETKETIPYSTVTREDPDMRKGKTRVSQAGSDGYRVQTYRKVYDDGKLISKEKEAYSVYTPHEEIVYVGTKEKKVKEETPASEGAQTGDENNQNQENQTGEQTENTGDAAQAQQAAN